MRQGRISLLLLVALWSCAPDDPPAPPPPPPAARPPEPPLPALGEVRFREWSEVDDEKFLELPAPAAPGELRWNFALGNRFGYSFTESLSQRMEREAGGRKALNTGREKNTGVFEFVAGRDQTALAGSKIQTAEASMNDQPISREMGWSFMDASAVWILEPASAVWSRPATNSKTPVFFSRPVFSAFLPPASRSIRCESDSVKE